MEILMMIAGTVVEQLQKPTLAFLIAGMMLAALGARFEIPQSIYKFIVILLLLKVGMSAGISIRNADTLSFLVPASLAILVGIAIVFLGSRSLARWNGVSRVDGLATAGLFGAVSASTLAAGMAVLDDSNIYYEGFIGALYPFMDVAALVTAIMLAKLSAARQAAVTVYPGRDGAASIGSTGAPTPIGASMGGSGLIREILVDTLRSPAISALITGLALGVLSDPETVYKSFYEPLFRGLLSILMLIMGMEAWTRLAELRKVAHAYVLYGLVAPILHGLLGFGAGLAAHHLTGFSEGGVILLALMAASSSDISGPPTIRGALPEANSSAYVGTSTGLGTPVAILSIPLFIGLADLVF
ncbi:sodium-dependent bicarbonate transport family permease [Hoeflea prorocentri]|uniref:Sodium-dependent bicarbonate transport family permease n=1 Tax=Hoeflea prorocentri TaxID=1922333 RepID=A0A9X3UJJ6_9HYPH|nr:sodium-dependent bicarbonate transport family permease [Hoeflea prorocentri]MCY6382532.1 sodium-dependent bicarbonate transport family permease [Hoeflea prorocentri]MDA5400332.1 sodium-dependent bicarbonate transport family permease [Hoeflea prorocentri]